MAVLNKNTLQMNLCSFRPTNPALYGVLLPTLAFALNLGTLIWIILSSNTVSFLVFKKNFHYYLTLTFLEFFPLKKCEILNGPKVKRQKLLIITRFPLWLESYISDTIVQNELKIVLFTNRQQGELKQNRKSDNKLI